MMSTGDDEDNGDNDEEGDDDDGRWGVMVMDDDNRVW